MLKVSPGFLIALPKQSSVLVSRMSPGFRRATGSAVAYTYFTSLIPYLTTLPDCATAAAAIDIMKSKLLVGAMQSFHASSPIHQWQRGLPRLPRIGSLSRGWARLQTQKAYFKENWIRRGVTTNE